MAGAAVEPSSGGTKCWSVLAEEPAVAVPSGRSAPDVHETHPDARAGHLPRLDVDPGSGASQ